MRREKTAIRDALLFWRRPGEPGRERSDVAPATDGQCLDDVAEVVVEGVVSLGEDGRIVEANRTFASTFGYEPSAVAGKALKDFVAPEWREPVEKSLSVGLEKPFKAVGLKKDGAPVNVEMRAGASAPRGQAVSVVAVRELTEHEEAEERLRRVEASYRNLVEQIPAVTYTQDPDSGHHFASVYLSPQAERLLGYTREEFASDAGLWVSLIHPEDRERVLAEDARTDETGEPFRMEYRLVARDGRVVWVRDEAVLVRSEDGSSVCWQGVMTEVTSRKRAEEALKESEKRFRSMVQNSSDIITLVGADGAVRYVSPAIERVLGYRPEERVGKHALDLVHPEDLERARRAFAEVLERPGLNAQLEFRVPHKDGSWRYLEHVANNLLDDPAVGEIVVNSRDVTERKEAEERLAESEQRFRSSFEDAAIGMALLTPDGRYLRANRSLCEMLGYTQEELLNMTFRDITHPDDLEDDLALGSRVLEGETRSFSMRKRYLTKDGAAVWVDLTVSLLRNDSGEPLYFVAQIQDVTERVRAEDALRQAEERYRTLVEQIPAITYVDSADGSDEPLYTSPQIEAMLGYTPEEWLGGRLWSERLHPDDRERVLAADERFEGGAQGRFGEEYRLLAKDGSVVWVREEAVVIEDEAGEPLFWQGVILDITERKEAEERLAESEGLFRSAFEDAGIGMALSSPDGRYLKVNRAFCGMVGYAEGELLGMTSRDITHPDDLEEDLRLGRGVLVGEDRSYSMEKRYVRKDGSVVWVHLTVSMLRAASGEPLYSIAQAQDITGRKRTEERLERRALRDALTGLPNRKHFVDRLRHALERTRRREGQNVAVLFMDLDGFKVLNDSLGHEAGDLLLTVVAQRLRRSLRPEDALARFGGDEFVVLIENVEGPEDAGRVAERINGELGRPFALEGRSLFASASIGIGLGNARTKSPEDLLRDADTAMYRAKEEGAPYRVFDPAMHKRAKNRLEIENDLRRAVDAEEFVLYYQPMVDLQTDEVWGVEALVRWEHPERGLLAPSEFVPVAEESGLVIALGERVLEEACRQAKGWQDDPQIPPLVVSVNLSALQLGRPDLALTVENTLRETGFDARRLSLDVTETSYIRALEAQSAALDRLKALGVGLSIDDFGAGYSSLSYLKRLPADALKIDRTFLAGLGEEAEDTAIVRMVIDLAHTLGMKVVAEGVEGWAQAALLGEMGCDLAQGFYFSEPLPPDVASRWLASWRP